MSDISRRFADLSPEKRELLRLRLERRHGLLPSSPASPPADSDPYPLTFEQERLWFFDQLVPGHPAYVAMAARVTGRLDMAALGHSLDEIVRRHDALRTRFLSVDGRPAQVIQPAPRLSMPVIDLRGVPELERQTEALKIAVRAMDQPFDLAQAPLVRVLLFRLGEAEHLLFSAAHHIVCDGWSLGVFLRELGVLYQAFSTDRSSLLPELPLQYREFVRWQRQRFAREGIAQLDYWKSRLADPPRSLGLPTDHPRPVIPSFMGARQPVELSSSVLSALRALSRREGATLFMVLLAGFKTLLHRCTGQDDILVGCPTSGRVRAETEAMIGFFANTLALRTDLSGDPPFLNLLARVRDVTLGAYAHQETPFAKVVEVARPRRQVTSTQLFEVVFSHLPPMGTLELPGLGVILVPVDSQPLDFDLSLVVQEWPDGLRGSLFYSADVFRAETAEQLARSYALILEQCVACPQTRLSGFPLAPELEAKATVARRRNRPPTIALASTFVAEPVEESLAFWLRELDLSWRIEFAPFDQVVQQLLDASSLLSRNADGINVLLLRLDDWQTPSAPVEPLGQGPSDATDNLDGTVRDFTLALTAAVERSRVPHLVVLCPPRNAIDADPRRAAALDRMEELLESGLRGICGVHLVTTAQLAAAYPVSTYDDPSSEALARVPFTPLFFAALGTMIARKIHALRNAPPKVLVLDCDQTLWKGACGEDGPLGVEVDPPRRAVQEFAVAQHDAGTLLCLCSRNNEEDVVEVFERRPEMPLRRDHIVSWRVNWQPKSENIRSLAEELGLGLESFVYIDDDPVACAEVAARCPEVLALPLPQDPDGIQRFLGHIWVFDRVTITEEDRRRTDLHRQGLFRARLRRETPTLEAFVATLGVEVRFSNLMPEHVGRVAQLTQRTNQFNLTTVKRSEGEVRRLLQRGTPEGLIVEVRDRFGDYGLVGVLLFECGSDALRVDTFLLSCRALGRCVEHRMLRELGRIANDRGLSRVELPYTATPKNKPALAFLEVVGAAFKRPSRTGPVFTFPTHVAMTLSDSVGPVADPSGPPVESDDVPSALAGLSEGGRARSALWTRVASELSGADQILRALESQKGWRPRPDVKRRFVPPRTVTEKRLVEIWAELLRVERIGVNDDFFELGGHSLLAVQLVSRLRHTWHTDLSLQQFFAVPTIAEIARALDGGPQAGLSAADTVRDLSAEAVLDSAIRPSARQVGHMTAPRRIFLTGATGFLGAFVLEELLQQTDADIYCLVRCAGVEEGRERLRGCLDAHALGEAGATARLFPVPGDLSRPLFGLAADEFDTLASTADAVYHVGATVNFVYPYSALQATNVLGTQEVLRLAARIEARPVHYVSTLGVFGPVACPASKLISEEHCPERWEGLLNGYFQSKWVAERLVGVARDRGLPVSVYRPGVIAGDSRSGAWNVDDIICRAIRVCIELGGAPDLDAAVGLTPVDYVSRAIVCLSRAPISPGKVFHVIQPQSVHWSQLVDWIRDCGYPLRWMALEEWQTELDRTSAGSRQVGSVVLLAHLLSHLTAADQYSDLRGRPTLTTLPQFDCRNTREGLAGSAIACPPIDAQVVGRYLRWLVRDGFLAEPPQDR